MDLKQSLSWKFLLPAFFVVYIIFRSQILGVFGDTLGLLAAILFAIGIIDLIKSLFSKKKDKPSS